LALIAGKWKMLILYHLCHARACLGAENRRIMIACGAGAGLAAVYNVPLGGALFTVEVLLGTLGLSALIPALATSVIAALVAWIGLGNVAQYSLPHLVVSPSLIVWSIVAGPMFGFSAFGLCAPLEQSVHVLLKTGGC
jgi:H+/Cl- antiporter ClcA